jgi:DNA-binding MarR family transcriptional regulator
VSDGQVRHVRLLETRDLFLIQRDCLHGQRIGHMLHLRRAHNGSHDAGPAAKPCQGDLRRCHLTLTGDLNDTIDDVEVRIGRQSVPVVVRCGTGRMALSVAGPVAGEQAAGERAVGDDADPVVNSEGDHLSFLFAVEQVVVVLHRDELGPSGPFSCTLRLGELPLEHVSTLLDDHLNRQLKRDSGLTLADYTLLAHLSSVPDHTLGMSELAERLKITRSRLTHAVTRLEEAGHVVRRGDPGNGRSQLAVLTDHGLDTLKNAAPGHVEAVRRAVFDVLSPEQVGQLAEIAEALVESLQRDDAGDDPAALPWRRR